MTCSNTNMGAFDLYTYRKYSCFDRQAPLMYVCLSLHPSIHLSVRLSIHSSIYPCSFCSWKKTIYLSWILAFATHSYTLARQTLNRVNKICRSLICVSILVLDNNLKICSQLWINMGVYILSVGFKLCWLNKCGTNCTGQYWYRTFPSSQSSAGLCSI